jgi:hypothetical protein
MTAENTRQQPEGEVFLVDTDPTDLDGAEGLQIGPSNQAVSVAEPTEAEPQPADTPRRRRLGDDNEASSSATTPEQPAQQPTGRSRLGDEAPVAAAPQAQAQVDPTKAEALIAGIRAEQNLTMGVVAGAVAALVGAIVWAMVTVVTGYQIGWMAIGVGCLVGGAVRVAGKGIDKPFGYAGGALSILACVLGNLLSICAFAAHQEGIPVTAVLTHLDITAIPSVMVDTFHPMDLLFYGLAISMGYRLSFRNVTQEDLARVTTNQAPTAGQ